MYVRKNAVRTELAEIPGTGHTPGMVLVLCTLQNTTCSLYRRSWCGYASLPEFTEAPGTYGYGSLPELTENPGRYTNIRSTRYECCTRTRTRVRTRIFFQGHMPLPRLLCHGRTRAELSQDPGTGKNVVENLRKFRVRVWMSYRTFRSSITGNTRENTPSMVLYVRTLRQYVSWGHTYRT